MKKINSFMLAVAGCFALASCSSDDNGGGNPNATVAGTYNMTSWNSPNAIDFDNDGTSSANMMDESTCYDNSKMVLHQDGTYTMAYNFIGITGTTASCAPVENTSGTWVRSGNTITTTSMVNGVATDTDYSFAVGSGTNGNTMTRYMTNAQYPTLNESGGAVWSTGNVNMVFSKSNSN